MKQDVVYAARIFFRRPGLFGLTIAGMAVAIGISTALFSIVRGVAFPRTGVHAPESVVRVTSTDGLGTLVTGTSRHQGQVAFSDYSRLGEASSSLELVASTMTHSEYRGDVDQGRSEPAAVMAVSDNYFSVLGFRAALGRVLTAVDANSETPVVVIGHGFWRNRLGADRSIIGRTVWLNSRPFTVVGVAAKGNGIPGSSGGGPPAFWTTLAADAESWAGTSNSGREEALARLQALKRQAGAVPAKRGQLEELEADQTKPPTPWNPPVDVLGRLKPGVALAQAEAETRVIATHVAGRGSPDEGPTPIVQLEPLDRRSNGSVRILAVLMTTSGLVVLLACANVTNVLLANAAGRRREIGTRLAIGASRGRVVRQLLTESLLLGLLGGALGLTIATAVVPSFASFVQVPPAVDVAPDLAAFAFVGLLSVAVGILAGLAPARYGWRGDLMSPIKSDQMAAPRRAGRPVLRSVLIGAQAMASIVLLVLAALTTRAVVQNADLDPGYDETRLVNVAGFGPAGARSAQGRDLYRTLALERIRQLPGVADAAFASIPPFGGVFASDHVNGRRVQRNDTSAGYFRALGMPVLRGRAYTADEVRTEAPVAVISDSLAQAYWGNEDPIGATLQRVWGADTAASSKVAGLQRRPPRTRVIGVVGDATMRLRDAGTPSIYLPLSKDSALWLIVRAQGDPRAILRPVREALEALDPSARVSTTLVLDGMARDLQGPTIMASLALLVGGIALGLAVIGLFGVTAFVVEHRLHEVSVRRALGATEGHLLRMLLRETLRPVVIGLTFGLFASLLGGKVVEGALYGVSSRDPLALSAAVAVLLVASTAAVYLPARRVWNMNPALLLKQG